MLRCVFEERLLEAIRDEKKNARVAVLWVGNRHTKEVLIDREIYLTGSLNALSFACEPDRRTGDIRVENMVEIVDDHTVKEQADRLTKTVREHLQPRRSADSR